MRLGDYIRRYVMAPAGETDMDGGRPSWATPPYVKQFDLLSAFPELSDDLLPVAGDPAVSPSAVFPPSVRHLTYYAWLGIPSSVTGLHSDDEDNILVMLQGWKQVVVIPPSDAQYCSVNDKFDCGTECCDVCPVAPNLDEFPEFRHARRFVAILGPGDALVLPIGWFHHVTSLSPSVSLNIFASTTWQWVWRGAPRALLQGLHDLGLYKPSHCVCHDAEDAEDAEHGSIRQRLWARLSTLGVVAAVGVGSLVLKARK